MKRVRDALNYRRRSTREDSQYQPTKFEDIDVSEPSTNQNVVADISNIRSDAVVFTGPPVTASPNMQSSVASSSQVSYNVRPTTNIQSDAVKPQYSPNVIIDVKSRLSSRTSRTSGEPSTGNSAVVSSTPIPTQTVAVSTFSNERRANATAIIRGTMPIADVIACLGDHGCADITDQVDASSISEFPFANGGFGDVYCGSLRSGSRVSLKCIRILVGSTEEGRKQLKHAARELYIWSKCQHPNVLELSGVVKFRGQIAMVSPWMEQGNLCWYISQNPHVERYSLCAQVSEGVAYLHSKGIVHGDIKGANVLVSEDGQLKLTDFGNAALREYTIRFSSTTSAPSVSMRWTAPEVVLGEVGTSPEADVYALGMTFLEVISGTVPYDGLSDIPVFGKIMNKIHPVRPEEHLPSNSAQADSAWSLMTSCWLYNAQERPKASKVRDEMKLIVQAPLS